MTRVEDEEKNSSRRRREDSRGRAERRRRREEKKEEEEEGEEEEEVEKTTRAHTSRGGVHTCRLSPARRPGRACNGSTCGAGHTPENCGHAREISHEAFLSQFRGGFTLRILCLPPLSAGWHRSCASREKSLSIIVCTTKRPLLETKRPLLETNRPLLEIPSAFVLVIELTLGEDGGGGGGYS